MKSTKNTTRRSFLKQATSTGVSLAVGSQLLAGQHPPGQDAAKPAPKPEKPAKAQEQPPAGEPKSPFADLRIAYIGTGGIGGHHLDETTPLGVRCPCYCDVDTNQFAEVAKRFPDARQYQDYRQMFDKEQKNIDAVMIGTPDHHHYPATILAMQLGKHVYTQKPLTHTPWEAWQLTEAARKYKVATQMGNQGHALEGWRMVYEWIRGGALGTIKEVHNWTDRPIWPQGIDRPKEVDAVPDNLNWDVWLGPAPERPYRKDVYHAFNWRGWWDFGAGALGDMACHTMDGMFWALQPGEPTSIEPVAVTSVNNETFPRASVVRWEFPPATYADGGKRPGFVGYWYDGGLKPTLPADLEYGRGLAGTGNLFIGDKAAIIIEGSYGDKCAIYPQSKSQAIGKPREMLERSPGHVREWLMACVGEKPVDFPKSNFAYAGPMTSTILLGNIAVRVGRRLTWDGAAKKFTNVPDANQYLTKEYREGWKF
ncbi:MAG: Inositol 2-dehydrogenase/D-chiro-inositol 3-dehydrogenase [Phycisphaerae bacterium]|nr:Inositol 2-dehydrogenase/D-chiro-inositol 3-dehydrogenase [Phycisphaerae bacterium]